MKLKKPAGETLLLFAEKTSLQFVLGHGRSLLESLFVQSADVFRSLRPFGKAEGAESARGCIDIC